MTSSRILATVAALALAAAAGAADAPKPAASPAAPAAAAPAPAAKPAAPAAASDIPTGPTDYSDVPGADLTVLDAAQRKLALKIMNEEKCPCRCGHTIASCRHKDEKCPVSPGIAAKIPADIKAGVSEAEIRKAFAPPPTPPPLDTTAHKFDYTGSPEKGAKAAKVTIAEFSEFQCPFCSMAQPWLQEILAAYPNDVRVVFKHFPLAMHKNADLAARSAQAAHAQGKFWPMHDKLFADVRQVNPENIQLWAKEIGLDMEKFKTAVDSAEIKALVQRDMKEGASAGVQGTPSFYINGKRYNGARSLAAVKPMIDAELKPSAAVPAKAPTK